MEYAAYSMVEKLYPRAGEFYSREREFNSMSLMLQDGAGASAENHRLRRLRRFGILICEIGVICGSYLLPAHPSRPIMRLTTALNFDHHLSIDNRVSSRTSSGSRAPSASAPRTK